MQDAEHSRTGAKCEASSATIYVQVSALARSTRAVPEVAEPRRLPGRGRGERSPDRRAAALYEDRVASVITLAQFRAWNEATTKRQAELRAEARRLEDRLLSLGRHADIEALLAALLDLPAALKTLDRRELRSLVWEVVADVVPTAEPQGGVTVWLRLPGTADRAARLRTPG